MLLDTGSDRTVLPIEYSMMWEGNFEIINNAPELYTANGENQGAHGTCELELFLGHHKFFINAIIMPLGKNVSPILGMDCLSQMKNLNVNLDSGRLRWGRNKFQMKKKPNIPGISQQQAKGGFKLTKWPPPKKKQLLLWT